MAVPSPVWLQVHGIRLSSEQRAYPLSAKPTYDYRTKHAPSPVQPAAVLPGDSPWIEEPLRPIHRLVDRNTKPAESLPGLIRGVALSRPAGGPPVLLTIPAPPYPSTSNSENDFLPILAMHSNHMDSLPSPRTNEQMLPDHAQRQYRLRSSKRSSTVDGTHRVSPPSIQQPQKLDDAVRRPLGQELSIKKQRIITPPYAHGYSAVQATKTVHPPSPIEHLDDAHTSHHKSLAEASTRSNSSSNHRRDSAVRPPLLPMPKSQATDFPLVTHYSSIQTSNTEARRPTSVQRPSVPTRDEYHHRTTDEPPLEIDNRTRYPTKSAKPAGQASNTPHIGSHAVLGGYTQRNSNDLHRPSVKSRIHRFIREPFQNLLTVSRPASNTRAQHSVVVINDATINALNFKHLPSRRNCAQGSRKLPMASHTIVA